MKKRRADPLPGEPFVREPMVDWFSPGELLRTGIQQLLSTTFGAYADNREIQAIRDVGTSCKSGESLPTLDYSALGFDESGGFWFDYVADLGDGFDSTYTIARQLGQDSIQVAEQRLPRGQFLVMGGDQVYPSASRAHYRNRLVGPYKAAFPRTGSGETAHLFAIPGNHDWYDGLSSFTRVFCQNRWIGNWKTVQKRSYFATKLPAGWWVWGLDIQLDSEIDKPQLDYFRGLALAESDKIILCVAEPIWLSTASKLASAYDSLAFFERETMGSSRHIVGLAGDLHAYARYEGAEGARQRFVAGGGGAYLHPTHGFPKTIHTPAGPGIADESFALSSESLFPAKRTSQRLTLGALTFPVKNWKFSLLFGLLSVVMIWLLQSASHAQAQGSGSLLRSASDGLLPMAQMLGQYVFHAPLAVVLACLQTAGLMVLAKGRFALAVGFAHSLAHLVVGLLVAWALMRTRLGDVFLDPGNDLGTELLMSMVLGGLFVAAATACSGIVWGVYLLFTNWFLGIHHNEAFSCQGLTSYKHFLRFRINAEGLTIYPIGTKQVITDWRFDPSSERAGPCYQPGKQPSPEQEPTLIEEPIVIPDP